MLTRFDGRSDTFLRGARRSTDFTTPVPAVLCQCCRFTGSTPLVCSVTTNRPLTVYRGSESDFEVIMTRVWTSFEVASCRRHTVAGSRALSREGSMGEREQERDYKVMAST